MSEEKAGPLYWQKTHPKGKWIIVKADPRVKKTSGGIELPDQMLAAERVMEGTGVILRVGSDREGILNATGGTLLEAGQRICFRGFLKDAFAEFVRDADNQPIFFLRAEDVIAVIGENVVMGTFQ